MLVMINKGKLNIYGYSLNQLYLSGGFNIFFTFRHEMRLKCLFNASSTSW